MKDNFSGNSNLYAAYRPTYPDALFEFLYSKLSKIDSAWDVGTGNGQVARVLSEKFDSVFATDISNDQLSNAFKADNIFYSCQAAEHTSFESHCFDLITVAQAIHWFDFDKFYSEVRRTAKPGALIAVLGYGQHFVETEIDAIMDIFYNKTLRPYWDAERRYVDEHYATIPFPFKELNVPEFSLRLQWSFDQYIGYLSTWSALKHYKKQKGEDPLLEYSKNLKTYWKMDEIKTVQFPVLFRLGEVG
ncbi:MAG: class I SAM-dependent methyltransferase [Bacteroidia bacterium]|nr:class I SAM-dependent methyltransferase [Bacteroidia bacterium]